MYKTGSCLLASHARESGRGLSGKCLWFDQVKAVFLKVAYLAGARRERDVIRQLSITGQEGRATLTTTSQ